MSASYQIILQAILIALAANSYPLIMLSGWLAMVPILLILAANILPVLFSNKMPTFRLLFCAHGNRCLKAFAMTLPITILAQLALLFWFFTPELWVEWLLNLGFGK